MKHQGFTLVELMVVIAISSILMAGLIRVMASALPIYRSTFVQTLSDETARVQLKRISHEIRSATPSDAGAFSLVEASPNRLIFYANIDADASIERVRYELIGTNLVRGIINPTGSPVVYTVAQESVLVVARNIQNGVHPIFRYYGTNYPTNQQEIAGNQLANITYIAFFLSIDADTTQAPPAVVVQSQVQLRNLKTNL